MFIVSMVIGNRLKSARATCKQSVLTWSCSRFTHRATTTAKASAALADCVPDSQTGSGQYSTRERALCSNFNYHKTSSAQTPPLRKLSSTITMDASAPRSFCTYPGDFIR
eukprot:4903953-Amphidinium_carterae.1